MVKLTLMDGTVGQQHLCSGQSIRVWIFLHKHRAAEQQ